MIEVKHLTKKYGDYLAVSDLSFTINEGHVYGFLGPNGAGKSTTMNMITGCLSLTEGEILVDGNDVYEDALKAKKLIGYLPEIPPLYVDMTPVEYLRFVAEAKGIKKSEIKEQIAEAVTRTGIENVKNRLIRHLSKGYKQRVGIAQAIIGHPRVIILDEPTVGLDPIQIVEIRDLIKDLGKTCTVILSSHILSEVQAICDEVLIISHGKLLAFDKTDKLQTLLLGDSSVDLSVEAGSDKVEEIIKTLTGIESYKISEDSDGMSNVIIKSASEDSKQLCKDLFYAFSKANIAILQLKPAKASLEDVFMELTESADAKEAVQ